MAQNPNILFFFTDDQRFDTIAALGNRRIRTPNLDRLVESGTTFTRAHIPGGTCGAVCMPSRAMVHSGRSLFHISREGQEIPLTHTTMGQAFLASGYSSHGIGKWHNGTESFARSFDGGAEIFFGGMGDHWNVPAYDYDPSGAYQGRCPFIRSPQSSNEVEYRDCDHIDAGKHSTDLFTGAAIDYLNKRDTGKPFFMYVSLMAPHDPRSMPQKYLDMYDPADIELPRNFVPEHPIDTGALRIRDEMLAAFPRDPDEIKRHIAEYYAMITHIDAELGRLIETLEAQGELKNTIIVYSGDNGLAVGQHGLMGKQDLYEHSVRVPLIFSGPGIPADQKCDQLVYLHDIYPTLCELTGTDIPDTVEGKSLALAIRGSADPVRDALYLAYKDSIRGISDGSYKLIEYACGATQLFDIISDPDEMKDLSIDDAQSERLMQMRRTLVQECEEWDDTEHRFGKDFWSARPDLLP